jgi:hypothetical protein
MGDGFPKPTARTKRIKARKTKERDDEWQRKTGQKKKAPKKAIKKKAAKKAPKKKAASRNKYEPPKQTRKMSKQDSARREMGYMTSDERQASDEIWRRSPEGREALDANRRRTAAKTGVQYPTIGSHKYSKAQEAADIKKRKAKKKAAKTGKGSKIDWSF